MRQVRQKNLGGFWDWLQGNVQVSTSQQGVNVKIGQQLPPLPPPTTQLPPIQQQQATSSGFAVGMPMVLVGAVALLLLARR